MSAVRLKGASEAIWEAYPESYLDIAQLVTELGGAEVIVLVLAFVYWLSDRERTARVAMFAITGITVVIIAKSTFALPRPVADGTTEMVVEHGDDEYGFPSGHAFMSVAVYGGFLYVFEKLRDFRWVLGVGILVLSISFSRIFLRVHYLGDIIVGGLLGIVFVLLMDRFAGDNLRLGFGMSILLALVAIFVSGDSLSLVIGEEYAFIGLGTGLGGFLGAHGMDAVPELQSRIECAILVFCGTAHIVVVIGIYQTVVGDPGTVLNNSLIALFHLVLIAGIFAAPVVSHELDTQRQRLLESEKTA